MARPWRLHFLMAAPTLGTQVLTYRSQRHDLRSYSASCAGPYILINSCKVRLHDGHHGCLMARPWWQWVLMAAPTLGTQVLTYRSQRHGLGSYCASCAGLHSLVNSCKVWSHAGHHGCLMAMPLRQWVLMAAPTLGTQVLTYRSQRHGLGSYCASCAG